MVPLYPAVILLSLSGVLATLQLRVAPSYDDKADFTPMTDTWMKPLVYMKPSNLLTFTKHMESVIDSLKSLEKKAVMQSVVEELNDAFVELRDQNLAIFFESADLPDQVKMDIVESAFMELATVFSLSSPKQQYDMLCSFVYPKVEVFPFGKEPVKKNLMAKIKTAPDAQSLIGAVQSMRDRIVAPN